MWGRRACDRTREIRMHLHYLIDKKNRNCVVTEGVVAAERTIDGELWLGALLPAGKSNRIVLPRASDHPHIQTGVDDPRVQIPGAARGCCAGDQPSAASFAGGASRAMSSCR
ncbi:MAG: hypothetical protein ACOVRP_16025 [Gemmatimonas sp.]